MQRKKCKINKLAAPIFSPFLLDGLGAGKFVVKTARVYRVKHGVPDCYQNDNVKKRTGMQWRHLVVSDLPNCRQCSAGVFVDRRDRYDGKAAQFFNLLDGNPPLSGYSPPVATWLSCRHLCLEVNFRARSWIRIAEIGKTSKGAASTGEQQRGRHTPFFVYELNNTKWKGGWKLKTVNS